jgi:hypothetical protein
MVMRESQLRPREMRKRSAGCGRVGRWRDWWEGAIAQSVGWAWSTSITEFGALLRGPNKEMKRAMVVNVEGRGKDGNLVKPKRAQELRYCTNRFGKYLARAVSARSENIRSYTLEFRILLYFCHM